MSISPKTATVAPSGNLTFTATVTGTSNTAVTWTTSAGSVSSAGVLTAPASPGTVTVTATSVADPGKKATATVTVSNDAFTVTVQPGTATVPKGGTVQFTATVAGTTNQGVTWSTTAGTISAAGLLTAPLTSGTVTVTATSVAHPSAVGTAVVTVTAASAIEVRISPQVATVLPETRMTFTATVFGTTNKSVNWTTTSGKIDKLDGIFRAPSTPKVVTVTATSQADPSVSASATITVSNTAVGLTVTPATASIGTNEGVRFIAQVANLADQRVTWSATGGTIDSNGVYRAGSTPGSYSVTATSVASPSESYTVNVFVNPIVITIDPKSLRNLGVGVERELEASVTGASDKRVIWTASAGTVDQINTPTFTSPLTPGPVTITATSVVDPSVSVSGVIQVVPPSEFFYDFESVIPTTWTPRRSGTTPSGTKFLGPFGPGETANLALTGMTSVKKVHVSFDLFIIGPWNGSSTSFEVQHRLGRYFSKTFSNSAGTTQTYPDGGTNPPGTGRTAANSLGYSFDPPLLFNDTVYHIEFDTPGAGGTNYDLLFKAFLPNSPTTIQWGIDNVRVTEVPPAG